MNEHKLIINPICFQKVKCLYNRVSILSQLYIFFFSNKIQLTVRNVQEIVFILITMSCRHSPFQLAFKWHVQYVSMVLVLSEQSSAHWPTLVHFGAEFNLIKFCDSLLCCPLMYTACHTRNREGQLPHNIARKNGYNDLAKALETFARYIALG